MAYNLKFQPNPESSISDSDYLARFLANGFEAREGSNCFHNPGLGVIRMTNGTEQIPPSAVVYVGFTSKVWNEEDFRPIVDKWLQLAELTDSIVYDRGTCIPLDNERTISDCVARIAARRQACFKGGPTLVVKDDYFETRRNPEEGGHGL